ncbi:hypothetical protein SB14R_04080 [Pseudomonas oryzihabitans]|nr:hypothetical protein NS376_02130 [Pseudomonas psychrotolerans]KTT26348.1 hypothetical protein SB14R_04080 [Pseudomonas psychrotolerans]KTT58962.1 hypothetical protein SB8_06290 [Pseudomonas psychrotolerans]
MKADFDYISLLLSEFFARNSVIEGLQAIDDANVTGWEIWLQVEFARFLNTHISEPEWEREVSLKYDRRRTNRSYLKPDFIIRKKHRAIDRYSALEFKQHPDALACIGNMLKDREKISKMRKSEIDLRSYWSLGVFRTSSQDEVPNKLFAKAEAVGVELSSKNVLCQEIESTEFSFLLC